MLSVHNGRGILNQNRYKSVRDTNWCIFTKQKITVYTVKQWFISLSSELLSKISHFLISSKDDGKC